MRREQSLDMRQRVVPADEPVMQRGQACGRERLERREILAQLRRPELEELRSVGNVLEPMATELAE